MVNRPDPSFKYINSSFEIVVGCATDTVHFDTSQNGDSIFVDHTVYTQRELMIKGNGIGNTALVGTALLNMFDIANFDKLPLENLTIIEKTDPNQPSILVNQNASLILKNATFKHKIP